MCIRDSSQPELEEVLDVNNNKDPEYMGHMDIEDEEKKKARKREADDYLVASKWKNRMIGHYRRLSLIHI